MVRNQALIIATAAAVVSLSSSAASAFVLPYSNKALGSCAEPVATRTSSLVDGLFRTRDDGRAAFALGMITAAPPQEDQQPSNTVPLPEMDSDGLYNIKDAEQHKAFLDANPDKIVVLKFYAPWCRACKSLAPKFLMRKNDEEYAGLPILWAQMSVQHNKEFIKALGVLALPSVLFYAGAEGLVENFPCGPSKIPIFKKKFKDLISSKINPATGKLNDFDCSLPEFSEAEPCTSRDVVDIGPSKTMKLSNGSVVITEDLWNHCRWQIPFFKDFNDDEFANLMKSAKLETFEDGQVVMKQGKKGEKFYIIESGKVEILVRGAFEDPLTTPSTYLGAVVNRFGEKDFFGERGLITGEPRAASIRATEKTRCLAFSQKDIPTSSVLSGQLTPTNERINQIDEKYAVDFYNVDLINDQFYSATTANQTRGSANSPRIIRGVDTDEDIVDDSDAAIPERRTVSVNGDQDLIVALLMRFKLLRHASRCFQYIVGTQPKFGDNAEVRRRSMLVSKLGPGQQEEFRNVYDLIDTDRDGSVSIMELKRAMESVGDEKSDQELRDMINKANPSVDGNDTMTIDDFMGVMAEADLYYLFMETFQSIDKHNVGFLKAGELDRALCGMRDLVSNDQKSIIDVDDKDMLINYDSFAKMLLGAE